MIDIRMIRENPELVKENIKKKFQDQKLALVDEVAELDQELRQSIKRSDDLRNLRNVTSKKIGALMGQGLKEEAEKTKKLVTDMADEMAELDKKRETLAEEIKKRMMVIPNIIDEQVPIGKDDS